MNRLVVAFTPLFAAFIIAGFAVTSCSNSADQAPVGDTDGRDAGGNTGGSVNLDGGLVFDADDATDDGGIVVEDAGPFCGNGIIDPELEEVCDDANALGGDGCNGTCRMIEPNFACPTPGEPCIPLVVCGNGTKDTGEGCDDANQNSGDGCSNTCAIESGWVCRTPGQPCEQLFNCGDGRLSQAEGEACDDGNTAPGDGCDSGCRVEEGWRCRFIDGASVCERASTCGDGVVEGDEQCDDGNVVGQDCCSSSCLVEATYCDCSTPGQLCIENVICGNGVLELGLDPTDSERKGETCDDGNATAGDGCDANCKLEPGWQCRLAGSPCVPDCGNGTVTPPEECDDGGRVSDDGCSSTCLVEPGYACTGAPSVCVASVCGNSVIEPGESCDLGDDNGLFYGDGNGCSKTCTQEPDCRPDGVTQACSTACGDGNHDADEGCDDGNQVDNDGCSSTCEVEQGFNCVDQEISDAEPCPSDPAGTLQCLLLPVIYRDFEGQQTSGGHPDFFYMSAAATGRDTGVVPGTGRTSCVPNASGNPDAAFPVDGEMCGTSDSVATCTGLVADNLDANGKPTLAKNTCPCRFTDWDDTGVLADASLPLGTARGTCWAEGSGDNHSFVNTNVTVIQSADTFAQWYNDTYATPIRGTIELAEMGTQFQFSSSIPGAVAGTPGRTVYDDLHDICLDTTQGQPSPAGPLESGFFPLEDEPGLKLCNIWPYWESGLSTNCCAGAGCPVATQWDPDAAYDNCPEEGTGGPIPVRGGEDVEGVARNFYFTTEVRYLFRYQGGQTLSFYGDDDVWVFVNGQLALDLGAPHERLEGSVAINATFGLAEGNTYEIAVFHADRHPRESNYQLTLSGFSTNRSDCTPRCGDGVVAAGEECDCGDGTGTLPAGCPQANADGVYGGCASDCRYGPFCGDGFQDPEEECDDGVNTAVTGASACGPGCLMPPYCGNGTIDPGEDCDLGEGNNTGEYGGCNADCSFAPRCGDGNVDAGEECDDGLNIGGYGYCDVGCVLGPRCGDTLVQTDYGETCDDGNDIDDDACTNDCGIPAICGDGKVDPGEQCDDGSNTGEYGGCNADCTLAPYCGDGVPQENEDCDYGALNTPPDNAEYGGCLTSCKLGPHCSDGTLQSEYEECDDGNLVNGDRCSDACRVELQ